MAAVRRLRELMGPEYGLIVSDVVGTFPGESGNEERLAYIYNRNLVESRGSVEPSSETMTHAALYDTSPAIRCVLHAHSPVVWRRARELRIPTTDASIPYGTPEMALAVQRLCDSTALSEIRILAMGGHEDGIVVFGRTPEEAGGVLLKWLSRAYEAQCAADGLGLCRS